MPKIHPTAIVDPKAELADDVEIGAYSIIKGHVIIGPGTVVQEHSHLHGHTVIGRDCKIGPAAYLGLAPQHLGYRGEPTSLIIGDDVIIRELATLHRSMTVGLDHATRIGDHCFIMGAAHIAHDCQVGAQVVMANAVLLAGHVTVGANAFLGGGAAFHQFVRVGRLAVIAGGDALARDVPPFAACRYEVLRGYNAVGCRRARLSRQSIHAIRQAYHCLHDNRSTTPALIAAIAEKVPDAPEVREIVDFIKTSKRGIVPSYRQRPAPDSDSEDDIN
ncbi:MAG TPA: acyl-ACP--UDP-N-acetylglucosamine O-acyltransferase [Tepidisphaeraceae bacterium]|nr:acyl-ACP--UDP-N-acetylglucosamine O-acyltransferase [Tepidisphaeraceae bacterium]